MYDANRLAYRALNINSISFTNCLSSKIMFLFNVVWVVPKLPIDLFTVDVVVGCFFFNCWQIFGKNFCQQIQS